MRFVTEREGGTNLRILGALTVDVITNVSDQAFLCRIKVVAMPT